MILQEGAALVRRLTTILAADVVGYSRLMSKDESGTLAVLKSLRRKIIKPRERQYQGRTVKLMGDGALMEFASVVDAVCFATEVQMAMAERNASIPEDQRIVYRIGINIGDIIVEGSDIYGDGVNVTARLENLCEPGGVCISRNVFNQVKGKLDLNFECQGEHDVKNIPEPVTVYRIGLDEKAAAMVTPLAEAPTMGGWRPWSPHIAGLAVILLAAVGLVWWQTETPNPEPVTVAGPRPLASEKPSLAVLPFDNLSADTKEDYFADGLTDDLITDLSKISGLLVIARNTVFAYKDRATDIRDVARQLGVRYVLEGSIQRAGNRIRINAQLIDSQTGGHLWADRFDRDAANIFAVQDEVIGHIVKTLAVRLSPSEQQRVGRLPTQNLEAYDNYLRAEQLARTGYRPKLSQALRLYEKATSLDPSFAKAFAAQARTEALVLRINGDDVLSAPVARKRAYEHASLALKIDSDAALPFSVLAELQTLDGRYAEALASAQQAIAIGPGEAGAYAALGLVLTFDGRYTEALAAFKTTETLDPNWPVGTQIVASMAYILADQSEHAVAMLERARDKAPDVDDTYPLLAAAYALVGRMDDARAAAAASERISPILSVELERVKFAHMRKEQDLQRLLDAMIKGGVQRWPYGFHPDGLEQLNAKQVKRVALGQTWQGQVDGIGPALSHIDAQGSLAFRTPVNIATGKAYISGDMLCEQIESLTLGREVCGPIYHRANPLSEGEFPYTYVNASKVFHFAVAK